MNDNLSYGRSETMSHCDKRNIMIHHSDRRGFYSDFFAAPAKETVHIV